MNLLTNSRLKKATKAYQAKMKEAMEAQRNGDIQQYALLYEEAETLLARVHALQLTVS